jgi:hypothetical protein
MGNHTRSFKTKAGAEMGPGWSAQDGWPGPFRARFGTPFDLAALRSIYSPLTKSHTSIHSSSAVEEQRREGHHSREERVEMVNYNSPSQLGNFAWKTTSKFQELESRSR